MPIIVLSLFIATLIVAIVILLEEGNNVFASKDTANFVAVLPLVIVISLILNWITAFALCDVEYKKESICKVYTTKENMQYVIYDNKILPLYAFDVDMIQNDEVTIKEKESVYLGIWNMEEPGVSIKTNQMEIE